MKKITAALLLILSWLITAYGGPINGLALSLLASTIGIAPILLILYPMPPKQRALTGFLWYAAVMGVQIHWFTTLSNFSDPSMQIGGWAAYIALTTLWALQFALFAYFVDKQTVSTLKGALFLASLWTILELSRLKVLSGFTWNPLGLPYTTHPFTAQNLSLFGIYSLSFYLVIQSVLLARAVITKQFSPYLLALALPWITGAILYQVHDKDIDQIIPVALLQTNSPPEVAFLADNEHPIDHTLNRWIETIGQIRQIPKETELILFPEYYVPFAIEKGLYLLEAVEEKLGAINPDLLVYPFAELLTTYDGDRLFLTNAFFGQWIANELDADVVIGLETSGEKGQQNSAVLFTPGSLTYTSYSKQILVPMGEEIPVDLLKPIAAKFGVRDSFARGEKTTLLYGKKTIPMGVSICYEETFSHLMRHTKKEGARLLLNLSNDIWYPGSSLPLQHFYHGKLRTIENGFPLIRACNGGVTSIISAKGDEVPLQQLTNNIFLGHVPIQNFSTWYTIWGDGPIFLFSLVAGIFFAKRKS